MPENKRDSLGDFIRVMFALVLVLIIITLLVRLILLAEVANLTFADSRPSEAELALTRAQDALASAELILSFLEGASVLVGVGLGAAAIYGYRSARELREDLDKELEKFEALWEEIEPNKEALTSLKRTLTDFRQELPNFNDLLRSTIEMNLKNYRVAHDYAWRVWKNSPDNTQALYLAGWLELQYIEDQLDEGVKKLAEAFRVDPDSASIRAAYGVGLRRQARAMKDDPEARRNKLLEALSHLRAATQDPNRNLLDLNRESFWGPIGGTERDLGNLDEALAAYQEAYRITRNSSYPLGNMAELHLSLLKRNRRIGHEDGTDHEQEAIQCFSETIRLARRELGATYDDYYPNMDLVMAHTMLIHVEPEHEHLQEAQRHFEYALGTDGVTSGMMEVSLGGWQRLQETCPDDWNSVEKQISVAITRLEAKITALKNRSES